MGLADRDYMRTDPSSEAMGMWPIAIALVLLAGIVLMPASRHWVQRHLGSNRPTVVTLKPLGVGPGLQLGSPYPPNDRWAAHLPARRACPGSTGRPSNPGGAEQAMVCVLNYARSHEGLVRLPVSPQLSEASRLKALDIIRCQQFSHKACGKDARAVADAVGYTRFGWGENIYAGGGPFMAPRVAADGWLNSEGHRENLFRQEWTEQGIAVVVAKRFNGHSNVAIWVSEFGDRR